jgi:hypothetical protein
MSWKLRSRKVEECEIGQVFEKAVKGMRNEMSTALWKIERRRDNSPEALKMVFRNGLEAMVEAVEKAMFGISDGLTKNWKDREQVGEANKARSDREYREREERNRKEEERIKNLENRLEREVTKMEERWREREERLRSMEERIEREMSRQMGEEGMRNAGRKAKDEVSEILEERIQNLEDKIKEGGKQLEKEDSEVHVRIGKLETDMAKERSERQELEGNVKAEKIIQDTKDSEKEMERKLEGAMEQMKILNLDFEREYTDRRTLMREAISKIKEKIGGNDRDEFDRIMKGSRLDILGKCTEIKETAKGRIHTVPVLITCGCRNMKERMEVLVKKAGLIVSFQWPKECMDFVDKIRDKVEKMGFHRKEYYSRIRPVMVEGRVLLRAEIKKKNGGKFEGFAYWRAPPRNKEYWKRISKIEEPEWRAGKRDGTIGPERPGGE